MVNSLKVLHIIAGLSTGGAETMLYKLLSRMDSNLFANQVVSLLGKGPIAEKIEALGVPVQALNMPRRVPDPRGVWRLGRLIRQYNPDVIQTWMYHADLIGGLAAKMAGKYPVIWNIRHSNLDRQENKKTTIWTAKACALVTNIMPQKIIVCCSESSRKVHTDLGYMAYKMQVIPNGFDLEDFKPDCQARESVRKELGLDKDVLLLGMVARFNPQKDHFNLVQADQKVLQLGTDVYFVLCGKNIDRENEELNQWLEKAGLTDRFFLLGTRNDIPRITAALDIACLSSAFGEGFPNVLGEAMACEVPCVATDVGDSAEIVGDTGRIVPPRDPEALARAIKELIDMGPEGKSEMGKKARQRVKERFELGKVVGAYERLYGEVGKG